jgi:hypothetical protein
MPLSKAVLSTVLSQRSPLPRPVLWWDANSNVTYSGSTFAWGDKISGNLATQETAENQPIKSWLNGKKTVLFDGTNDYLLSVAQTLTGRTIYVVAGFVTASDDYDGFFSARVAPNANKGSASNNDILLGIANGQGTNPAIPFTPVTRLLGVTPNVSDIVYFNNISQNRVSFNDYQTGIPSAGAGTGSLFGIAWTQNNNTSGSKTFCFGADIYQGVGNRHVNGHIAEILVYDAVHTAQQMQGQYISYLKPKWGLP